jgi:hypothetical protein
LPGNANAARDWRKVSRSSQDAQNPPIPRSARGHPCAPSPAPPVRRGSPPCPIPHPPIPIGNCLPLQIRRSPSATGQSRGGNGRLRLPLGGNGSVSGRPQGTHGESAAIRVENGRFGQHHPPSPLNSATHPASEPPEPDGPNTATCDRLTSFRITPDFHSISRDLWSAWHRHGLTRREQASRPAGEQTLPRSPGDGIPCQLAMTGNGANRCCTALPSARRVRSGLSIMRRRSSALWRTTIRALPHP